MTGQDSLLGLIAANNAAKAPKCPQAALCCSFIYDDETTLFILPSKY